MHTPHPSEGNNFLYPTPLLDQINFLTTPLVDFWNFPNMMPRSAQNAFRGQKSSLQADKFSYPPPYSSR